MQNSSTVLDSDLDEHVADTPLFMVIRNRHFVELTWNELTSEEKRQIYINIFNSNGWL